MAKHHSQHMILGPSISTWSSTCSGVLQGSFLGPILFNIPLNDLNERTKGMHIIFMYDTKLGKFANNPNTGLITVLVREVWGSW